MTDRDLFRCMICGCRWRQITTTSTGGWSLVEGEQPGKCCDNHPGFLLVLRREFVQPEAAAEAENNAESTRSVGSHRPDFVDVVLSRGPGPHSDFVELRDPNGRGIGRPEIAEWVNRSDGFAVLRVYLTPPPVPVPAPHDGVSPFSVLYRMQQARAGALELAAKTVAEIVAWYIPRDRTGERVLVLQECERAIRNLIGQKGGPDGR